MLAEIQDGIMIDVVRLTDSDAYRDVGYLNLGRLSIPQGRGRPRCTGALFFAGLFYVAKPFENAPERGGSSAEWLAALRFISFEDPPHSGAFAVYLGESSVKLWGRS